MHRPRERLVRLAKKLGVELRPAHQRCAHAKQFTPTGAEECPSLSWPGHARRRPQDQGEGRIGELRPHPLVLPRWERRQRQHQRRRKPDPTACTLRSVFNLAPIA